MVIIIQVLPGRDSVAPKKSAPSISRAIEKLLSVKESANLRAGYINSLRLYLLQFARGRLNRPIDQFTAADIERWFAKRNEAPTTRASNLGRLSSLFAFCARRGWISENICDRVEKTRLDPKPPKILTIDEIIRLIDHVATNEKSILAYVALGLFAGLRPGEIQNLSWEAIDLVRERIRIDATITKVRRMRWVRIPKNCLAWLKLCEKKSGKVAPAKTARRRALRRVRKFMGWKAWPQDILRHTAASYMLAITEDAGKLARRLGNSTKVLLANYHELVLPEDGKKFSKIRPKTIRRRNVQRTVVFDRWHFCGRRITPENSPRSLAAL